MAFEYYSKRKKSSKLSWLQVYCFFCFIVPFVLQGVYFSFCRIYQIDLPLKSITLFLGNVHIYESNLLRTYELLNGVQGIKFELNV